jgi:hypothetical protein
MGSNTGCVSSNRWLIVIALSSMVRQGAEAVVAMADPWGELKLELWWMKFNEVSSYRFMARRGAHLRQFWSAGGDDLGWLRWCFPPSGGP